MSHALAQHVPRVDGFGLDLWTGRCWWYMRVLVSTRRGRVRARYTWSMGVRMHRVWRISWMGWMGICRRRRSSLVVELGDM